MSSIKRVARAIREQDRETAERGIREIEYADVRRVNPLSVELHSSSISLDEEDLTLTQWVRSYDSAVGIAPGDTLAVKQMRGSGWLVTDVVGDGDLFEPSTATIADGSITSAKLANDSVTAAKIATDAVGASEIAAGAVGSSELADDSVTADKLRDDASTDANRAVTTNHLRDLSVTSGKLASNAVTSAKIATDAVGSAQIAADAVTSSEIAADAVGASEIAADAVGTSEIAANAVTSAEIATDAVGSAQIAAGAVGTSELADGSVTGAKTAAVFETQTVATFTPATADAGKIIGMDRSTTQTVIVDGNLNLTTGRQIDFVQLGTGQVQFQQGSGATLNATPGLNFRARYSAGSLLCVGTDTYVLIGDLSV